jgi:hypothetical protein
MTSASLSSSSLRSASASALVRSRRAACGSTVYVEMTRMQHGTYSLRLSRCRVNQLMYMHYASFQSLDVCEHTCVLYYIYCTDWMNLGEFKWIHLRMKPATLRHSARPACTIVVACTSRCFVRTSCNLSVQIIAPTLGMFHRICLMSHFSN